MNYNRKTLEDLYSQVAGKPVAQRKHLDIWTEQDGVENTSQERKDVEYNVNKIKELVDNIDIDHTDADQMKKLYNVISTFPGYRPIKKTLEAKGFNPKVLKKFSNEIQSLIVDLPEAERQQFFDFLKKGSDVEFPVNVQTGNLYELLINVAGVSRNVAEQIMRHTGQDAAKRGVGMGELALALLFSNIDAAGGVKSREMIAAEQDLLDAGFKSGMRKTSYTPEIISAKQRLESAKKMGIKGDLELNGKEFEIKGDVASLGPTSDAVMPNKKYKPAQEFLNDRMGIRVDGAGYVVGTQRLAELGSFPAAISLAYKQAENKREFEEYFKEYLSTFGQFDDDVLNSSIYNKINLADPRTIQRGIPVLNLYRYTKEEGFPYFMAHDVGERGAGTGKYVFAAGSPEDIANQIYNNKNAKFEKVKYNGLRPRIGFQNSYVEDNESFEMA